MNTSLPNPLLAQYVQFDESLRGIYDRLGPSVLIPLDDDGKPLAVAASFTETQSAEYLRRLSTSNIAVRCGSPSANLCAIMFSEEQVFQTFLLSNPGLRETCYFGKHAQPETGSFFLGGHPVRQAAARG